MIISPSELHGKLIALLVWEPHESGAEGAAVFFGVAKYDGNRLILIRGEDKPPFVVFDDWMSRIKPVTKDVTGVFEEAEYYLSLSIGSLPPGIDPSDSGYLETGLTWPFAEKPEDS